MKLINTLLNKLQVFSLKQDLKSAQNKLTSEDNWEEIGRRGIDCISKHGKFLGNFRDAKCTMRFALAGIKEAGAVPSLNRTEGIPDAKDDYWLQTKQGKEPSVGNMGAGGKAVMAAYAELAAAIGDKQPQKASSPQPSKSSTPAPAPSAASSPSQPQTPKSPIMSTTPTPSPTASKPGPLAGATPAELAKTLTSPFNNPTGKANAKAELSKRDGYFVIESTPFVAHWKYLTLTSNERTAFHDSGGRIAMRNPSATEMQGTAAEFVGSVGNDETTLKFTGSEYDHKYPVASAPKRTMEQFLSLSRGDIKAIAVECSLPRGTALRRELFDATLPRGSFVRPESERNLVTGFRGAFHGAFSHIARLGPNKEDEEAPPALQGQISAEELLALPADAAEGLNKRACYPGGRIVRREIKTAYQKASSTQKAALMSRYKVALERHIHEYI